MSRRSALSRVAGLIAGPFVLASLLLTAGCSHLPRPGKQDESPEVLQLKRQVAELQRRATVSEVEATRLRQEVAQLEGELAAERSRPKPSIDIAERATPLDAPAPVLAVPAAGPIEEIDLEPDEPPTEPPPAHPPSQIASANRAPASGSDETLYDAGYTLFHQKNYALAEQRFAEFLSQHPDSELADNAQFWIGECRYARGDLSSALAAFMETVERYPTGNKVPDALLKAARCLESLGDSPRAQATYRELVERFPASAAAAAARERIH